MRCLQNLGPYPHSTKAGLWQCSQVWPPSYTDDMSSKTTEFCSLTSDLYPKTTGYNASLELIYRSNYKILVYAYKTLNLEKLQQLCGTTFINHQEV